MSLKIALYPLETQQSQETGFFGVKSLVDVLPRLSGLELSLGVAVARDGSVRVWDLGTMCFCQQQLMFEDVLVVSILAVDNYLYWYG